MTQDELKMVLEALKWCHGGEPCGTAEAIAVVEKALAQPEQEPLEYWNAVEGWVKIDEVRTHFDSVGCATIYKTAGEGRVPLCLAQPEQEPKIGCVNHDCDQCKAQPEQEPVAIKRMKEWIEYLKRKSDFGQHMKIPSEMSAGTCWELALELEQFINTTPPQRPWIGLTDEEFHDLQIENIDDPWANFKAIEVKLKERNQ